MVLVRIATIKSRVKGHHVNNYKYTIGEELECKLEVQNRYSTHAIMALANEKNEKSKGKTSKKLNKARKFRVDYGWSYSRRFGSNLVSTYENLENLFDKSKNF